MLERETSEKDARAHHRDSRANVSVMPLVVTIRICCGGRICTSVVLA
jgi:hypothetical protein